MPNILKKVFRTRKAPDTSVPEGATSLRPGTDSHAIAELPSNREASAPVTSHVDLSRREGDDLTQNGDFNGAVVVYNMALRHAPSDTRILMSRSLALMLSTPPRLDLALQDVDTVIQISPTHWQGWQQKSEILQRKGDFQGAEEALMNAVGFARGFDQVAAQRLLDDVRTRRHQSRPAVELLSPSATSIFPASSPSLPTSHPSTSPPAHPPSSTPSTYQTATPPTPSRAASSGTAQSRSTQPATLPLRSSTSATASPRPTVTTTATSNVTPSNITSYFTTQASAAQLPGTARTTTASQPTRTAPITRTHNQSTVNQTPTSSLPLTSDDLIDLVDASTEAPPGYTPSYNHPDPTIRTISQQDLNTRLTQLRSSLAGKNKGSLSIRPYTKMGSIDAVQLLYVGMMQLELTSREIGVPTYLHPSFRTMAADSLRYPGSTLLDMDCETSGYYDGKVPGTVSIMGYSEEYREHQLLTAPLLHIVLEGQSCLPTIPLDRTVNRIRKLQLQPTLEDNEGLREFLGFSQLEFLQSGFLSGGTRQTQIDIICMSITRSFYDAPARFIDFSKARNFSNNMLGSTAQGIGLQSFLYQILLGAELLIRLQKEPITTSYTGIITDNISALMVLSNLWMQNVTIQGPAVRSTTMTPTPTTATLISPGPQYIFVANCNQRQSEGLIRFGEAMSWPYMDEARQYLETAYQDLTSGRGTFGWDIYDWLFGLILPGKTFRHRIMCCLVYASPSIRSFKPAPYFDNGIVVGNKSYWPKRTVLGRVLGGLRNPRSVCGWIGPVSAPSGGNFRGWIRINARRVDVPVPLSATQASLEELGFGDPNRTETPESRLASITDPNEWIQPIPPTRAANETGRSTFKGIHLAEVPRPTNVSPALSSLPKEEYRASLDFEINSTTTRFTLYSNPIFVSAPPCVGTHTMHRRQAQKYLSNIIKVADLKESYPGSEEVVIIDALGDGEEVIARAWCAERARHAVVRRGEDCCFACATLIAETRAGLGIKVLIWSR